MFVLPEEKRLDVTRRSCAHGSDLIYRTALKSSHHIRCTSFSLTVIEFVDHIDHLPTSYYGTSTRSDHISNQSGGDPRAGPEI